MPTVKKEKRYINLACSFGRKFAPRRGICKITNYCLTYSVLFGIGPINGSLLSSSLPALLFFRSSRYPSPASSHLTLTEEIQKRLATWWVNRELPPLSNVYTAQEGCQEPFAIMKVAVLFGSDHGASGDHGGLASNGLCARYFWLGRTRWYGRTR